MARSVTVTTPENVRIEYELAGLASRGGAAMLDLLLQGLAILVVFSIRILLERYGKWPGTTWAIAILGVVIFCVWYGYFVFFETVWSGQTPGKRYARLRTIREGGLPMNFSSTAVRNLVRVVDFLPVLYLVGGVCVLFHSRNKRLGDIAGGTMVVKERTEWMPHQHSALQIQVPRTQTPITRVRNIELISAEEFEAVKRFVERMPELDPEVREQVAHRIAEPLMSKLGIENPPRTSCAALLQDIYAECIHTRGMR